MGYYVRLLSPSEQVVPFNEMLEQVENLKLTKGTDACWEQLHILSPDGRVLAILERHPVSINPGTMELEKLKNEASRGYPESAREWIRKYFTGLKTLYIFELLTDSIDTKEDWRILGRVQNLLKDKLEGIIQSDNEGYFNEAGDYILWQMYAGAGGTVPAATLDDNGNWITFQLHLEDEKAVERFKQGEMPRRSFFDIIFRK